MGNATLWMLHGDLILYLCQHIVQNDHHSLQVLFRTNVIFDG